jgi:hypothetical protein
MAGYPASVAAPQQQPQQQQVPLQLPAQLSLGLPAAGGLELGGLWGSAEGGLLQMGASPAAAAAAAAPSPAAAPQVKPEPMIEEWLTWDDWQLPALF